MLLVGLLLVFLAGFSFVLGLMPISWEHRPTLQLQSFGLDLNYTNYTPVKQKTSLAKKLFQKLALINKPIATGEMRTRLAKDLAMARVDLTVEEFILVKELLIVLLLALAFPMTENKDFIFLWLVIGFAGGWLILPQMIWLKTRIRKVKDSMIKDLPDTVDLLALCVNAGLDFMMALKYLVEKSPPTILIQELSNMMQEINVGKPRRDALRDLSRKYELPDLATFSRTLIQADRMGTSVSEALNILSEDMREARFRRGETQALKAPLKMLVPLLFFIFPVVAILVAGPIFMEFFGNNPVKNLGH